jgi:DNA-binding transcriptional regulator GbsR (MarR family)
VKFEEAKASFIESWGQLGSQWGINRTMAQVQALLLTSGIPLCTDDIMKELNISRGNANMNIRELISWGIVYKSFIAGDRKEYFRSEKDPLEIARKVARERRKRELEPLLHSMQLLKAFKPTDKKGRELKKVSTSIYNMARQADGMIDDLVNSNPTGD